MENIESKVPQGSKLAYKKAPTNTPTNRELYTSFVTKASIIAKRGGKTEYQVPKNIELFISANPIFKI